MDKRPTKAQVSRPQGYSKESDPGTLSSKIFETRSYSQSERSEMFLLPHFRCSQIKWRVPDDFKPVKAQSPSENSQISVSKPQCTEEDSSQKCMDGQVRPQGCILTHSSSSSVPTLPGLHVRRRPILFQGTTVRPFIGPLHFFKNGCLSHRSSPEERDKYNRLFRRSNLVGTDKERGSESAGSHHQASDQSRVFVKPRKISVETVPDTYLARFLLENKELLSELTYLISEKVKRESKGSSGRTQGFKKNSRKPSRSHGICSPDPTIRKVALPSPSEVYKKWKESRPSVSDISKVKERDSLVVIRPEPFSRGSGQRRSSNNSSLDRRVWVWIRCTQRLRRIYSRKVVRRSYTITYKWQRAFSRSLSSGVRIGPRRRVRCFVYRQQNGLLCYQEQRFKQISDNSGLSRQSCPSYGEEKSERLSGLHSGSPECNRGRSFQRQGSAHRMGSESSLFSGFSSEDRVDSRGGPHGYSRKHKVTRLRLAIPGVKRSSNRFLLDKSGEVEQDLYFPTPQLGIEGSDETAPFQGESSPDCSVPTVPIMVPNTEGQSHSVLASAGSPLSDCSGRTNTPSFQRILSSSRVDFLRKAYTTKYGLEIADRLVKAFRTSTLQNYESCWKSFQGFLHTKQTSEISEKTVLDFLEFLFTERKLSPKTVLGYRTALAEPLQLVFKIKVSDEVFSRLIRAQFLARPSEKKLIPNWDVSPVLEKLASTDYVIKTCDLESLLTKTIFLVSLATGNRASEISAIQRSAILWRLGNNEVVLPVKPSFLFKNQSMNRSPPNIIISRFADCHPELCPILCLQEYLMRTSSLEGDLLFLHPKTGRNLQRPSLSLRITKFISEVCPDSFPRMHDLRKQATSLAWTRGVPPSDIVKSAFWSSSSVFVQHYLFPASDPNLRCVALNSCGRV